ncbi:MAG: formylglycine-generating enzyme family protein [Anaerolineales bacterium]|nr:formylglycine-generating enzyme family protein [Anaerolineales bacterium]MCB8940217.1 formylglycine-generating enzyme family protein [Ardenticatenaceae bacterium]
MNVDTAKLRQFINEYFGPEDLRTFLFDYFRSVYDDLTEGLTKSRQIALLLEYCHKHKKFQDLLAAIQRERPFFQPDDYVQGQKAPTAAPHPPADPNRWIHPKSGLEMVPVLAGEFLYGNEKESVYLDEFWIAKTPLTNGAYARFVVETGHKPPQHWKGKTPPAKLVDHPVVYVSWEDAEAYAKWIGGALPTEQQWEKAARGTDGRSYPWGEWRNNHCNTRETGINTTTPVGQFSPRGDSPFGCVDMSGNVWEWTASLSEHGSSQRVLRGGSWRYNRSAARAAYLDYGSPAIRDFALGFRVVVRPSPSHLDP